MSNALKHYSQYMIHVMHFNLQLLPYFIEHYLYLKVESIFILPKWKWCLHSELHVPRGVVKAFPVLCKLLSTVLSHLLVKVNTTSCHLFSFIHTFAWIFLFSIAQHEFLQRHQNADKLLSCFLTQELHAFPRICWKNLGQYFVFKVRGRQLTCESENLPSTVAITPYINYWKS